MEVRNTYISCMDTAYGYGKTHLQNSRFNKVQETLHFRYLKFLVNLWDACKKNLDLGFFTLIPNPECFGHFGGDSLTKPPPFRVTNRRRKVAIICPARWKYKFHQLSIYSWEFKGHTFLMPRFHSKNSR